MAEKIRSTWRHLAFRAKLWLGLVALCGMTITGALALDDAYVPWGDSRHLGTNDDIIDSNFPSWFGMAFKTGAGVWDTNVPAWCVSPSDTNDAALGVLFNRSLLTNSLIMKLDYLDTSNASLALDLLLITNQIVMKSNLFENILTGSGVDTSRTFNVSLLATNTVGLQFRRGTGPIMIRDTLLSPDGDGDGYSDTEELAWGSDPNSAFSVPRAAIAGQVCYAGAQPGVIHVLAATNANDWASSFYLTMTLPPASCSAPFTLPGLPLRRTYYARAWRDVNGNQTRDYWEPSGIAVPSLMYLGSNTGGVVIVMSDPDSDGDGMSDAAELALGMDPQTSNTYARLPFIEGFETNTVHLGDLKGQNGWQVSMTNVALVQTGTVYAGAQALGYNSATSSVTVRQLFARPEARKIWVDFYAKVAAATAPTGSVTDAAAFYFNNAGQLVVWDGLRTGTNHWTILTNATAVVDRWGRVSVQLDYDAQTWLICFNGMKVAEGLGFAGPVSELQCFATKGNRGNMDNLTVSTNMPSGLSLDGDNLPDDWEMAHFGNLDQTDNGDFDHDGLSNIQEYRLGTDSAKWSTVNDGIPDGWKVAHGMDPLDPAVAAQDPDHDGLSNLGEYRAGTDPQNASSHCWSISGVVTYTGPQTGLIRVAACTAPTGGAAVFQVSGVATGAYTLAGLPPNSNYWIRAWRDTNGNGSNDFWEAQGLYINNPVILRTNNVTGINITLADPDSDGDGMPDWWEMNNGLNPTNAADALIDTDGDGIWNVDEYLRNTSPTNAQNANIVLYVDAAIGSDANRGLSPTAMDSTGPKLTIPAAIDTALSGDAVQVAPGQYAGGATTWNVRNKTVRLVPKGTVTVK